MKKTLKIICAAPFIFGSHLVSFGPNHNPSFSSSFMQKQTRAAAERKQLALVCWKDVAGWLRRDDALCICISCLGSALHAGFACSSGRFYSAFVLGQKQSIAFLHQHLLNKCPAKSECRCHLPLSLISSAREARAKQMASCSA